MSEVVSSQDSFQQRTRVKYSTTTKGVVTAEVVVEMFDTPNDIVMQRVNTLYVTACESAKNFTIANQMLLEPK